MAASLIMMNMRTTAGSWMRIAVGRTIRNCSPSGICRRKIRRGMILIRGGLARWAVCAEVPKVTFLLSTFNRRNTLLNTLGNLKSLESLADFSAETVVVDNASSDGTADAVASEFPAARLVRQKTNRGACAKNAGLTEANGEYIVFLDDDSYPDAQSIRRMIQHFRDEPRLGAAVFDVVLPNGQRECSAYPAVCIGCGTGFRRKR